MLAATAFSQAGPGYDDADAAKRRLPPPGSRRRPARSTRGNVHGPACRALRPVEANCSPPEVLCPIECAPSASNGPGAGTEKSAVETRCVVVEDANVSSQLGRRLPFDRRGNPLRRVRRSLRGRRRVGHFLRLLRCHVVVSRRGVGGWRVIAARVFPMDRHGIANHGPRDRARFGPFHVSMRRRHLCLPGSSGASVFGSGFDLCIYAGRCGRPSRRRNHRVRHHGLHAVEEPIPWEQTAAHSRGPAPESEQLVHSVERQALKPWCSPTNPEWATVPRAAVRSPDAEQAPAVV